ncbi:MAG: Fic family protein [Dehalococcoidia bacterium]|nr:Fic family protein [Dehalococcoidia bacterium]
MLGIVPFHASRPPKRLMMGIFRRSVITFRPHYRVTDRILNSVTRATAAKELIAKVRLPPEWMANFHREAMLKTAHASVALEGSDLSFTDVMRLAERGSEANSTAKQQVINYLQALESSATFLKDRQLTEDKVLQIHYLLTENILEKAEMGGVYRKGEPASSIGEPADVLGPAPKAKDVPALLRGLLKWVNSFEAERVHPVLQAGLVHYEIMRVRPFVTGNGLMARYLATLLLNWRNFDAKRIFCLDEYYTADKGAYFEALKPTDQKRPDMTGWLEYYADGVAQAVVQVKDRIVALSSELSPRPEPPVDLPPTTRSPL